MGHPSRGTEGYRILGFNLETGSAGRLTIQTVARDDKGKGFGRIEVLSETETFSSVQQPLSI
jgi:hypothetical protein